MQLIYRGISYKNSFPAQKTPKVDYIRKYRLSEDYHLSENRDSNKIAWVRPIRYYIYRGVSYTKSPMINATTQLLK